MHSNDEIYPGFRNDRTGMVFMKRFIVFLMALTLLLAFATPALANAGEYLYVDVDSAKVFNKPNTDSKVLKKLKGGTKVRVLSQSEDNKWYCVKIKLDDETKEGWIQRKYLSEHISPAYCKHDWSKWHTEKEPTCTKAGKKSRDCSVCWTTQTKEIPKLGHDWGKWKTTVEPTCSREGEKKRACRICGKQQTEAIKKADHKWGKWKTVKEPTCTREGEKKRICSECKKEQTESIEKTAHEYGAWMTVREATCTVAGERQRACRNCDYVQKETMSMLPHEYSTWTILKEATCTEAGEREHTCAVCGRVEKQTIPILPHEFKWEIVVEATDHSSGTRARICANCGLRTDDETYDPDGTLRRGEQSEAVYEMQQLLVDLGYLNVGGADGIFGGGTEKAVMLFQKEQGLTPDGIAWPQTRKRLLHDFGAWETVKPLTRTESGERVRICRDCGFEQRETIEMDTVLERGRRGEDVRAIQQLLTKLGYDTGSYDGIYGQKLDNAFTDFAAAHGFTFEQGKVRPGDIDALVNAWIDMIPDSEWRGESTLESPVNMALSITPLDDAADPGTTTYIWSLTNLGNQTCRFVALLLTYDFDPDFHHNDLVMVIDGIELKPNCGNSATGHFTVSDDWGEGNLNFAAIAVSDSRGAKWLSNIVTMEDADS